jgi:hypothetical protein
MRSLLLTVDPEQTDLERDGHGQPGCQTDSFCTSGAVNTRLLLFDRCDFVVADRLTTDRKKRTLYYLPILTAVRIATITFIQPGIYGRSNVTGRTTK